MRPRLRLQSTIGKILTSGEGIFLPDGFLWSSAYPLRFSRQGSRFACDFNLEAYAAAPFAGTQYYVSPTGSDANTGLSSGQALRSIHAAITKGNLTAAPFFVLVAAGSYPRENGFTSTGTLVPATQPCAIIGSGLVECWTGSNLTWPGAVDPSFDATYLVARSNVAKVLDLAVTNANGDYAELTRVTSDALCQSTPSSWYQSGANLRVNRTGAPTNANTRVLLLSTPNLQLGATSKNMYVSGIHFQGGSGGAVAVTGLATLDAMFSNCTMKYAGALSVNVNGLAVDNITGLVAARNCVFACNQADGANGHKNAGAPLLLTIDCIGRDNGRDTALSANGWSIHESMPGVDVGGEYHGNYGTNFIPIGTTHAFALGTIARDSLGDIVHGGTSPPIDFQTQNSARLWLNRTRSYGSATALAAADTSIILHKQHSAGAQAQTAGASASIGTYYK